ncbi:hypothetical protein RHGRI_010195 [Rhododendron griersonianum]|uniref:Uncharacterized protein n=1 Tax=Rhododendron griersonianum TaxID=479676 RepID=A0AAV6KIS7_9ERIC|nr:hypothetical protein RHGRI_010195 [Rhododendron griersonianum]
MAEKEEAADLVKTRAAFWIKGKYDPRDYSFENFKRWVFTSLSCSAHPMPYWILGRFHLLLFFQLVRLTHSCLECTLSSFNKIFSLPIQKKICDDRFC